MSTPSIERFADLTIQEQAKDFDAIVQKAPDLALKIFQTVRAKGLFDLFKDSYVTTLKDRSVDRLAFYEGMLLFQELQNLLAEEGVSRVKIQIAALKAFRTLSMLPPSCKLSLQQADESLLFRGIAAYHAGFPKKTISLLSSLLSRSSSPLLLSNSLSRERYIGWVYHYLSKSHLKLRSQSNEIITALSHMAASPVHEVHFPLSYKIEANFELGIEYFTQENWEKAVDSFQTFICIEGPKSTLRVLLAHYYLGRCFHELGKVEVAYHYYSQSLQASNGRFLPPYFATLSLCYQLIIARQFKTLDEQTETERLEQIKNHLETLSPIERFEIEPILQKATRAKP